MSLFKRFTQFLFSSGKSGEAAFYPFQVRCRRCGEVIRGQVNLYNDPSIEYDEKGIAYYICRKVLIGNGRCYQPIEVLIRFNANHELVDRAITDGEFVEGKP